MVSSEAPSVAGVALPATAREAVAEVVAAPAACAGLAAVAEAVDSVSVAAPAACAA